MHLIHTGHTLLYLVDCVQIVFPHYPPAVEDTWRQLRQTNYSIKVPLTWLQLFQSIGMELPIHVKTLTNTSISSDIEKYFCPQTHSDSSVRTAGQVV